MSSIRKLRQIQWLFFGSLACCCTGIAQGFEPLRFPSGDGHPIIADYYPHSTSAPVILMFHQSVSSRGEYRDIAKRLNMLGFNCLAMDLRWGKRDFWNKVINETAKEFGTPKVVDEYEDTEEYQLKKVWPIIWKAYEDMVASVRFAREQALGSKIIVMGSSFSAMLVFKLAGDGLPIDGIASFSPGEYHPTQSDMLVQWLPKVDVPVYLSSGQSEYEPVDRVHQLLASDVPVVHHQSAGRHGASVLINESEDWPTLVKFLNQFRDNHGFAQLKVSRRSVAWDSISQEKSVVAWMWYPMIENHEHKRLTYDDYVNLLNEEKGREENRETFHKLMGSLTSKLIADSSFNTYLRTETHFTRQSSSQIALNPTVILSGAHPIYFAELAEILAHSGFTVISVPRSGIQKGGRLPFNTMGVEEYANDLSAVISHLESSGILQTKSLSFISWSFEGAPTLKLAAKYGAKLISLDSSIGYSYGISLFNENELVKPGLQLLHYTGKEMSFGRDLGVIRNADSPELIINQQFDWAHSDFTSLASTSIPQMNSGSMKSDYLQLILEIINYIKTSHSDL